MMTADYAGAVEALRIRFVASWLLDGEPRTRIAFVNQTPEAPWPPKDGQGNLAPWVLFEVEGNGVDHAGTGTPRAQVYLYRGHINLHVYVPVNSGTGDAIALAVAAGEIFRNRLLYEDVSPGCYLRTWSPEVDGGGQGDDDGVWFRASGRVPFEYFHRA